MKLIKIYECLCDETRLRILHLLAKQSLSVSDLQYILNLQQVKISKHLAYLRKREMVEAKREGNRMIYSLPKEIPAELEKNLNCLQDCIQEHPIFLEDLNNLKVAR